MNRYRRMVSGHEIVGGKSEESEDEPESVHLHDVYEIEERYRKSLNKARAHLDNQKKPHNRAKLSPTRIAYILKHGGICPTCSVPLEGANHNTEHILPLSLGGDNDDSNRVQLCSWCNTARNQTFMGINRGEKYPENWIIVKQYVLWSELTLDEGIRAGAVFPSIQDRFVVHRWGPNFKNIPKKPQNVFGRASEWGSEAKTQTAHAEKQHREAKVQTGKKSPVTKPHNRAKVQDEEKFPVTKNLNSGGSRGLRLPSEPKELAEVLVWVATDSGNFTKYIDLREALKDTGIIPKHRAVHTLRAIFRAVSGTGTFEPEMVVSIDELSEICDKMWMNCSGRGDWKLPENVTPPDEEGMKKYFENVKRELMRTVYLSKADIEQFPVIPGFTTHSKKSKRSIGLPKNPTDVAVILNSIEPFRGRETTWKKILEEVRREVPHLSATQFKITTSRIYGAFNVRPSPMIWDVYPKDNISELLEQAMISLIKTDPYTWARNDLDTEKSLFDNISKYFFEIDRYLSFLHEQL